MKHEIIDLSTWDRTKSLGFYREYDMPYIIVTANVDVTNALEFAHKNKVSFNLVMVYLCNKTADSIINYRYRFDDKNAFIIEYNQPKVNHILPGEDIFIIASCPWPCDDILEFCRVTHANYEKRRGEDNGDEVVGKNDIINYTSIPWIQYTHFFRTIDKGGKDNNPKISFGKYFKQDGRVMMPVSSQTHHALMDGRHVGMFYEGLQKALDELK